MTQRPDHSPDSVDMVVTPTPSNEELAAIVAAYRALWPKPAEVSPVEPVSTAWRFSGRWFNRSL